MKRVIIIQARMTSTRLPGKVLKDLCGKPMLAQQIDRLKFCKNVDEIIVATTTNTDDDLVVELAVRENVGWFRGSEHDVLSRFMGAAQSTKADLIVRITADCPLIDPKISDDVISALLDQAHRYDYASNVINRTYPRGLDVEVFFMDMLQRLDRMARTNASREHVTIYARSEHPDLFQCLSIEDTQNNADLRWTVDTTADFEMVKEIFNGMNLQKNPATFYEILAYVRQRPEICRLNMGIETWDPNH